MSSCKRPAALHARHVDAERHANDIWGQPVSSLIVYSKKQSGLSV